MSDAEWSSLRQWLVPFDWRSFFRKYGYLVRHGGGFWRSVVGAAPFFLLYGVNQTAWFADQLFTPNWPRTPLKAPVFIIGHQRSGSTFLHRLLAGDPNALALQLHQMVLPAIVTQRAAGWLLRPGTRRRAWLDRVQQRRLGALDAVHRIRLDSIEEDEFVLMAAHRSGMAVNSSPAVVGDPELNRLRDYRSWPEADRRQAMEWYRACLLKAAYRAEVANPNPDRWIVGKNPAFSQRIPDILKVFPDARFIHLVRNPLEAVPSRLSLVRAIWRLRMPEIDRMDEANVEELVADSERTYRYPLTDLKALPPENAITIRFEELTGDPAATLERIYRQLNLAGAPVAIPERRPDASGEGHQYDLSEFGLTEKALRVRFASITEAYGF